MLSGVRGWVVGVAALVGVITVAVVAVLAATGASDRAEAPRVRVSVPGLEADLLADGSGSGGGVVSEVVAYDGVEQLQAAFNADAGHPRVILLVDPT